MVKWSPEVKQTAIHRYEQGESSDSIGQSFGIPGSQVRSWLRRAGVKTRKAGKRTYSVNEDFFARIDSEEKAYVLGFIAGDGTVSEDKGTIRVVCKPSDSDVLYKIRYAMGSNHPIQTVSFISTFGPETITRLSINSQQLIKDMKQHGYIGKKEERSCFPYIPEKYRKHFARGLFDADGCMHLDKNGTLHVVMSGQEKMLTGYMTWVKSVIDTQASVTWGNHCYQAQVNRKDGTAADLLDEMYMDAKIYLDRKYALYRSYSSLPRKRAIL